MHRGWAELFLDRCRGLVEDTRQARTQTRETGEGDAEANEYFNFYQTRDRGGRCSPARARGLTGCFLGLSSRGFFQVVEVLSNIIAVGVLSSSSLTSLLWLVMFTIQLKFLLTMVHIKFLTALVLLYVQARPFVLTTCVLVIHRRKISVCLTALSSQHMTLFSCLEIRDSSSCSPRCCRHGCA